MKTSKGIKEVFNIFQQRFLFRQHRQKAIEQFNLLPGYHNLCFCIHIWNCNGQLS